MYDYFWVGVVSVGMFVALCMLKAKKWNPLAIIKRRSDDDPTYSASLTQMFVFTTLTIFSFTSVFAARAFANGGVGLWASLKVGNTWLNIPSNLLILMGISVGTAVASRAIKVQQANAISTSPTLVPTEDKSSMTRNADGKTDLVKIQMLFWTLIAVLVYLRILWVFMGHECYAVAEGCPKEWTGTLLPDIDTAFMVLLGVSQGGHVANQLSQTTAAIAGLGLNGIASVTVAPTSASLTSLASTLQLTPKALDVSGKEVGGLTSSGFTWASSDLSIATVDQTGLVTRVTTGTCNVTVSANGATSDNCVVTCT